MDARLALRYFPGIYIMSIAAWGVFQTAIGHYIMAPIFTSLLLANLYFIRRIAQEEKQKYELIRIDARK